MLKGTKAEFSYFSGDPQREANAKRLRAMYDHLFHVYGPQKWWPAASRMETIVGAYLTQNTSWRGVEHSIRNLAVRGVLSVGGLREVDDDELRRLIRPSGYMVRKSAALKAFVAMLDSYYGGLLETLAEEDLAVARHTLLALPGVGPETADAILLYALGRPAMVVDEYLRRVTTRHGLLPSHTRYAETQALGVACFRGDEPATLVQHYNEFHALIVMVGKSHCGPNPRCESCPLAGFLPPEGRKAR